MKTLRKRETLWPTVCREVCERLERETLWPTECREVCESLQATEIERDSLAPRHRERERERDSLAHRVQGERDSLAHRVQGTV